MATPARKFTYKVLFGRVETRIGKTDIAAEAGQTIELSDSAAAKLVAKGIVAPATAADVKASAPIPAKVEVIEPAGGATVATAAPAGEATPAAAPPAGEATPTPAAA